MPVLFLTATRFSTGEGRGSVAEAAGRPLNMDSVLLDGGQSWSGPWGWNNGDNKDGAPAD